MHVTEYKNKKLTPNSNLILIIILDGKYWKSRKWVKLYFHFKHSFFPFTPVIYFNIFIYTFHGIFSRAASDLGNDKIIK